MTNKKVLKFNRDFSQWGLLKHQARRIRLDGLLTQNRINYILREIVKENDGFAFNQ